jgi:hypothetical protein
MVTKLKEVIRFESKPNELMHASVYGIVRSVLQRNAVRTWNCSSHSWCVNVRHSWCLNIRRSWCVNISHSWCVNIRHSWCVNIRHSLCVNIRYSWRVNIRHPWCVNIRNLFCFISFEYFPKFYPLVFLVDKEVSNRIYIMNIYSRAPVPLIQYPRFTAVPQQMVKLKKKEFISFKTRAKRERAVM